MSTAFLIGSFWGIKGLAWAWVAGTALLLCATIGISKKPLGLDLCALIGAVAPPLVAALVMASVVESALWMAPLESAWTRLIAGIIIGLVAYPAVLLAIAPDQLKEAICFIRHRDEGEDQAKETSMEAI